VVDLFARVLHPMGKEPRNVPAVVWVDSFKMINPGTGFGGIA
jgi:hypothetical protein